MARPRASRGNRPPRGNARSDSLAQTESFPPARPIRGQSPACGLPPPAATRSRPDSLTPSPLPTRARARSIPKGESSTPRCTAGRLSARIQSGADHPRRHDAGIPRERIDAAAPNRTRITGAGHVDRVRRFARQSFAFDLIRSRP